jgi:hypothetical protein
MRMPFRAPDPARGPRTRLGALRERLLLALSIQRREPATSTGLGPTSDYLLGRWRVRSREALDPDGMSERETWFYFSGTERRTSVRTHGLLDGAWIERGRNGKPLFEATYSAGVLHGKVTAWRKDGTKAFVGELQDGAQSGEWFFRKRDGSLDRERTGCYRDGQRISGIRGFNEWLGSP